MTTLCDIRLTTIIEVLCVRRYYNCHKQSNLSRAYIKFELERIMTKVPWLLLTFTSAKKSVRRLRRKKAISRYPTGRAQLWKSPLLIMRIALIRE